MIEARSIFLPLGLLIAGVAHAQTPQSVELTAPGDSFIDPEVLQAEGRIVYQTGAPPDDPEGAKVWLAELDPATGTLVSGAANHTLVDQGITPLALSKNGPEFGLDASGWSLYYDKEANGVVQIWRAVPDDATASSFTTAPVVADDCDRINPLASEDPSASETHLLYPRGRFSNPQGKCDPAPVIAFMSDDAPEEEAEATPLVQGEAGFRIASGTTIFTATSGAPATNGQILLWDASDETPQVITNDADLKFDPYPWRAPEFGGELLVVAQVDRGTQDDLVVYRDLGGPFWTRIATLTPPAGSSFKFVQSQEPFTDGAQSYISLTLKKENLPVNTGVSEAEIWIYGIDDAPATRFTQRCDDGEAGYVRHEAETFHGDSEVFLYYNRRADPISDRGAFEMWLCVPGLPLREPPSVPLPTGAAALLGALIVAASRPRG